MSGEQTMREHLELQKFLLDEIYMGYYGGDKRQHIVDAKQHAVAALALLNEAVRDCIEGDGNCVLVIDPPRAEA